MQISNWIRTPLISLPDELLTQIVNEVTYTENPSGYSLKAYQNLLPLAHTCKNIKKCCEFSILNQNSPLNPLVPLVETIVPIGNLVKNMQEVSLADKIFTEEIGNLSATQYNLFSAKSRFDNKVSNYFNFPTEIIGNAEIFQSLINSNNLLPLDFSKVTWQITSKNIRTIFNLEKTLTLQFTQSGNFLLNNYTGKKNLYYIVNIGNAVKSKAFNKWIITNPNNSRLNNSRFVDNIIDKFSNAFNLTRNKKNIDRLIEFFFDTLDLESDNIDTNKYLNYINSGDLMPLFQIIGLEKAKQALNFIDQKYSSIHLIDQDSFIIKKALFTLPNLLIHEDWTLEKIQVIWRILNNLHVDEFTNFDYLLTDNALNLEQIKYIKAFYDFVHDGEEHIQELFEYFDIANTLYYFDNSYNLTQVFNFFQEILNDDLTDIQLRVVGILSSFLFNLNRDNFNGNWCLDKIKIVWESMKNLNDNQLNNFMQFCKREHYNADAEYDEDDSIRANSFYFGNFLLLAKIVFNSELDEHNIPKYLQIILQDRMNLIYAAIEGLNQKNAENIRLILRELLKID